MSRGCLRKRGAQYLAGPGRYPLTVRRLLDKLTLKILSTCSLGLKIATERGFLDLPMVQSWFDDKEWTADDGRRMEAMDLWIDEGEINLEFIKNMASSPSTSPSQAKQQADCPLSDPNFGDGELLNDITQILHLIDQSAQGKGYQLNEEGQ